MIKNILSDGIVFSFLLLFTSCNLEFQKGNTDREWTKLEKLMTLSVDSIMDSYDLSNDSLTQIPDLSKYTIKSLDLSSNLLDTLIVEFLPKGIKELNLSRNKCTNINIRKGSMPSLKTLDVSFNLLRSLYIEEILTKIVASHNDLRMIRFVQGKMQYLDISYNPHLSRYVEFIPALIDTLIYEGTTNDVPLINKEFIFED